MVVLVFDPATGGIGGAVGVDADLGEVDGLQADLLGEAATGGVDHGLAGGGVAIGRVGPAQREAGLGGGALLRSEEHTSELQSQSNLVCRLLLEKKKKK